jgi:beta-1,2-mannobiose phosphorylase / 1,2-beta-oligomannan phosphorylase
MTSSTEMRLCAATLTCSRLGVVMSPDGSPFEIQGVLNPGVVRDRNGVLLLYPRCVAQGNVSRIGLCEVGATGALRRLGFVLEPQQSYELRSDVGGYGCEDARVTFVPELDRYVMTYTAYGEAGARIAVALSTDARAWQRLGLVTFPDAALNAVDNKDAAFFPEPVRSPAGIPSFAFFHRPMRAETINGQTPIPVVSALRPEARETLCIAYVPVADVLADRFALCKPTESFSVLPVGETWGSFKNGAGTPPIRTVEGWLSVFHAVDVVDRGGVPALYYRAGIMVNDIDSPHRVVYRSPQPLLAPHADAERFGVVNDVVFPTGIDVVSPDAFDVYYGGADMHVLRARFAPAESLIGHGSAHS